MYCDVYRYVTDSPCKSFVFRWDFFQNYTLRTLNLKIDKWGKFIGNDDMKQIVVDFMEKKDKQCLVIYLTPGGALCADEEAPESSKTKGVFFAKLDQVAMPKEREKFEPKITYGDLSQIRLEHLSSFVDDVVDGILSFSENFSAWPTVVSGDVQSHVHKLKSEVYEVSGSVKGFVYKYFCTYMYSRQDLLWN